MSVNAIATSIKPGSWTTDRNSSEYIPLYSVVWIKSSDGQGILGPYVVMDKENNILHDPTSGTLFCCREGLFLPQDQISNQYQLHDRNGIHKCSL